MGKKYILLLSVFVFAMQVYADEIKTSELPEMEIATSSLHPQAGCTLKSGAEKATCEKELRCKEEAQQKSVCNNSKEGLCITIDKNFSEQWMTVFKDGKLAHKFKVSTGRETFDIPTNFKLSPNCSNTKTGVYGANLLREINYSNTWLVPNAKTGEYTDGAEMKHSIFFNGGIAIHAAGTEEAINALGPKTSIAGLGSGGCVRLNPDDAQTLFDEMAVCKAWQTRSTDGKQVCATYDKMDPLCPAERKNDPKCKDEIQWPVRKKEQKIVIEVIDSRCADEQQKVKERCAEQKDQYLQAQAECLIPKMKQQLDPQKNYEFSQIERFQFDKDPRKREIFKKAFEANLKKLPVSNRNKMNFDCNKSLYYAAKENQKKLLGDGANPYSMNDTYAKNQEIHRHDPLPPPKPKKERPKGLFGWFKEIFR